MPVYPIDTNASLADWSSVGDMKLIRVLYSGKLISNFREVSVLTDITNTDYEGEIRTGADTVVIRTIPEINVSEHEKGATLVNQSPESDAIIMKIDHGLYWSFRVDDPDEAQTDIPNIVNQWASQASYNLRNKTEQAVLAGMAGEAGLQDDVYPGQLGTSTNPLSLSSMDIKETLVDLGVILDENLVPEEKRFLLAPPIMIGAIKKSDYFSDASRTGDDSSVVRNGKVGIIDRFTIYRTGNLLKDEPVNGKVPYACLFGVPEATTFASQLLKTKSLDNPEGFGMLHRGLHVFGYKVIRKNALGVLWITE